MKNIFTSTYSALSLALYSSSTNTASPFFTAGFQLQPAATRNTRVHTDHSLSESHRQAPRSGSIQLSAIIPNKTPDAEPHPTFFAKSCQKMAWLLTQDETLAALGSELRATGRCTINPGSAMLMELQQFTEHHEWVGRTMPIPSDSRIANQFVKVANQLEGYERYQHCSMLITKWEPGMPPQPWHTDSPMDKMVWVLTAFGEPTWLLDKKDVDEYCSIYESNEIIGGLFDCELPETPEEPIIQKAKLGSFVAFHGGETDSDGEQLCLVHKAPGTIGALEGRATLRTVFE